MAATPRISSAEWEVMRVIWSRGESAAADVAEAIGPRHGWADRTVKTMLSRLASKGALTYRRDGKRYLYRAKVTQSQCIRAASRSFLKRIFAGDAVSAMAHFVENTRLSDEQIDRLKRLLEDRR